MTTEPGTEQIVTQWDAPAWATASYPDVETIVHTFASPALEAYGDSDEVLRYGVTLLVVDEIELVHGRGARIIRTEPEIVIDTLRFTRSQAAALATTITATLAVLDHHTTPDPCETHPREEA